MRASAPPWGGSNIALIRHEGFRMHNALALAAAAMGLFCLLLGCVQYTLLPRGM